MSIPFYLTGDFKPRYYQEIAVNKVIEAIAEDKKRIIHQSGKFQSFYDEMCSRFKTKFG